MGMTKTLIRICALTSLQAGIWMARAADFPGTVFTREHPLHPASPFTGPFVSAALIIALWLCSDHGLRSLARVVAMIRPGIRVR